VRLGNEMGSLEAGEQADLTRWRLRRRRLDLTELNLSPVLEAPVRCPYSGAANPGLYREPTRGQNRDGRGPDAGARW
jgi:hypothetical protein